MTKYLIIAIFLFGCNKAQRQLEKTQLYLFKHPEFTAEVCAEKFPDKADSVIVYETKTDTLWELIQFYDTTSTNDTIRITDHKTKVVTKTIWRDSIIYRENRAEQERLQLGLLACGKNNTVLLTKNQELENSMHAWKKKAKTRWLWIALLIGGAAAFTVFKVVGKFKSPIG
jgi:hypothetical protein